MAKHSSLVLLVLAACGGKTEPPPAPPRPTAVAVRTQPSEQEHHAEIVAEHRKIEEQQQDAFALACTEEAPHAKRCKPSCYEFVSVVLCAGLLFVCVVVFLCLVCLVGV